MLYNASQNPSPNLAVIIGKGVSGVKLYTTDKRLSLFIEIDCTHVCLFSALIPMQTSAVGVTMVTSV